LIGRRLFIFTFVEYVTHNLCCQIWADDNSSTCAFTTGKSVTCTGACVFVNKWVIHRLGIISLTHAPVHVTDFPVVNAHVDELSSAQIWQHKLCVTYSTNVNINNRLPIKVYYRICTLRHQNWNNSWKPECVLSFNMGWQNLFWVLTWVGRISANPCC
jgi:hypothetical protein